MFRVDRPAMFTTWTYKQAGHSIIDRGNRIRPEKHNRKNIQKITWRTNDWVKGFGEELESRVGSMTIADVSPAVAIRRVILLYENQEYRELHQQTELQHVQGHTW
ncbi:hypothetical protein JTE90_017979 [Oedothorax gibbosus]|uniref:Uncharacterized protein n=1 Tax=Oedothorax gibbosus TaxID=931172 RepID=A0AAV6V6U9_9ARAC|nr:hypothetical protein JTE90_017979 [Oedothorax gibbosus]